MTKPNDLTPAMLRTMCDTLPDMIWAKDLNKRYLFVNQAICDSLLFATDTDEPIGKTDMYFVERERASQPENPEWHTFGELCQDSDDLTIQANKPMQFDEFGNIKGEFVFLDVRKAPLRDANGTIIGVVGSARNVTYEKKIEKEKEILSQAIEQAAESVIITDKAGNIEYVNSAFSKITGFSQEEVLGRNPRILKSGNQTAEYYTKLWQTISSGKTWQSTLIDRRKDGSLYPALMTVSPILDEHGNTSHYVGLQQDMTENELLENKFRQAQKMETLGVLVGGIAHDFNNMLSGILGNLYLAKKKVATIPEAVTNIENVEKLSHRAADIISQLMAYARKGAVQKRAFELVSFSKEVSKLIDPTMPKHINYKKDFCADETLINGDATQIQQVLMNLLNNARDAVQNVSNPFVIFKIEHYTASTTFKQAHHELTSNHFAHIVIEDNGYGISDENKEKVFEPFYTTKEVGSGTGLGLSMVLGCIQEHGGIIELDSKPNKGTRFNIYLPIYSGNEGVSSIEDASITEQGDNEMILLVDDNLEWLDTGKEILESINYRVVTASSGLNAIEVYKENMSHISLIIMDVIMPRVNGVDASTIIRGLNPDTKIIFTSGYLDDPALKDLMPSKNETILCKPCSIGHWSESIRKKLDGQ